MLAKKPPMGWNSWNTFGPNISEKLIIETVDAIVDRGLRDAGYEYVVIDDCWSLKQRGKDGRIVADPEKFPHGMKYLANYVHSKGLKFGMYSCCGHLTCAGYPGSFDHEFIDAETFADFGVDFLKYDNCWRNMNLSGSLHYYRMGMALKATGREILFSACNWGHDDVWSWIRSTGAHMYRSTGDIFDSPASFRDIAMSQIPKLGTSAPGCFNDPDMLICGMYNKGNVSMGGCTKDEYEMHFALWCMMNAPLMIGCDVRSCDDDTLALLKNKAYIAVDQDEEARPPFEADKRPVENVISLFKHLSNNEFCYGIFNFSDRDAEKSITLFDIGFTHGCGFGLEFEDLKTGEKTVCSDLFNCFVGAHTCKVFRCRFAEIR